MKRYLLLIALCTIIIIALALGNIPQPEKVVIIPHIIIKEIPVEVEVIKEVEVIREVERPRFVFRDTKEYVIIGANATQEELTIAYNAISYGIRSHQSYVNSPLLCNASTGDAEWNEGWVYKYNTIEELLDRAYGGLK